APAPSAAPDVSSLRVLIVDDSGAARAHVRSVLTNLGGRHFVAAADGDEAVQILQNQEVDLVVTDYNMPRMNGLELVNFIRQRSARRSVPIIMVTTETDPAKLTAVRQAGVSGICDKRFQPETVRGHKCL